MRTHVSRSICRGRFGLLGFTICILGCVGEVEGLERASDERFTGDALGDDDALDDDVSDDDAPSPDDDPAPGDYIPADGDPAAGDPSGTPPDLVPGVWTELTPPEVSTGAPETCIAQGLALDPNNPSTLYWTSTPYTSSEGGLWKSTDAGSSWRRVGAVAPAWVGATDHLDEPLHVRVDPTNSNHLYVGDGVRGSSQGFFVSWDGGETFEMPDGFRDAVADAGIDNVDLYDVAVDPADFLHVLLTWHYRWGWDDTPWKRSSGVFESKDGGDTWTVHAPELGWGTGHAIKFLYAPHVADETRRGNSSTWLLLTQDNGFWRTTNAGESWSKVSEVNMNHGGAATFYTSDGTLYAPGLPAQRSYDNGATWSSIGLPAPWSIFGAEGKLYSASGWGATTMYVSDEADGMTWEPYNEQIVGAPYEMAYDASSRILYSSNWYYGLWALKLP